MMLQEHRNRAATSSRYNPSPYTPGHDNLNRDKRKANGARLQAAGTARVSFGSGSSPLDGGLEAQAAKARANKPVPSPALVHLSRQPFTPSAVGLSVAQGMQHWDPSPSGPDMGDADWRRPSRTAASTLTAHAPEAGPSRNRAMPSHEQTVHLSLIHI